MRPVEYPVEPVPSGRKPLQVIQLLALAAIAAVVFGNTLGNELLWDDTALIRDNTFIRQWRNIPSFFTPRYWNEAHPFAGHYRPVRTVTFALDYSLWGLNPAGYHATNILLHVVNVLLIFYLARLMLGAAGPGRAGPAVFPFLAALFFAVHPIHTESINFVKNRSELLALLFSLLSLLLFVRHFAPGRDWSRRARLAGAWFCLVPALLSKEAALTLPGVALWYAVCFFPGRALGRALVRVLPFGLIMLGYFWFTQTFIQPATAAAVGAPVPSGLMQQALTVVKTAGIYVKMLAAPFALNAEHAFAIPVSPLTPSVLLSLAVLALIAAGCLWLYRRERVAVFAVGWIFLTLLPASNLIYLASRPIAEQRLYIPSAGFCLLLGYGLARLWGRSGRTAVVAGLLTTIVAGLYAGVTVHRNTDWRDALTFYSKTLAANPNSARMHCNLGYKLCERGDYEASLKQYWTALRLEPYHAILYNQLGTTLVKAGRLEEATFYYETALRLNPYYPEAHNNLGAELMQAGRVTEAIAHYRESLRLRPYYSKAHVNLALALSALGRSEEAIGHFKKAISVDPDYAEAHFNLGVALVEAGRLDEAADHYRIALRLDPDCAKAHNNLGVVLAVDGQLKAAVFHYRTALRLEPDCAQTHNNLGAALVRMGRHEEAITHYFTALRLDTKFVQAMNNLGMALVETGHVEEGIGYYRSVLKIMPDNADAYCNLGVAAMIQGRYDQANEFFRRSLAIDPDHPRATAAYQESLGRMGPAPVSGLTNVGGK